MKEDEENDYARYLGNDGKLEDVRSSNLVFSQMKVSGYLNFYFALVGIGSSIVASEINMYHNFEHCNKEWVLFMMSTCNVSTILLSKNFTLEIDDLYSPFNHGLLSNIHQMEERED